MILAKARFLTSQVGYIRHVWPRSEVNLVADQDLAIWLKCV